MHFSVTELVLIAFIAIVLFGTKKVRMLGGAIPTDDSVNSWLWILWFIRCRNRIQLFL